MNSKAYTKTIAICPICQSKDIEQLTSSIIMLDGNIVRFGAGSYCRNCGVKFQYDTPHLQQVLDNGEKIVKEILAKK